MKKLISARLRDMALRYDYEDRPLLIEAAEALERHLLARLEAELETAPPEVACNDDTRRLDALEKDVNEHGPLLLHNLRTTGNFRGLGLASTERSLRKAIDDMSPPAASVPSPLAEKP